MMPSITVYIKNAMGKAHDHLIGGFYRYSVDE